MDIEHVQTRLANIRRDFEEEHLLAFGTQ
ncbi:hypothetical protein KIPB_009791, partial [Kipferlia bialata]|eukprot:g9791.t1